MILEEGVRKGSPSSNRLTECRLKALFTTGAVLPTRIWVTRLRYLDSLATSVASPRAWAMELPALATRALPTTGAMAIRTP